MPSVTSPPKWVAVLEGDIADSSRCCAALDSACDDLVLFVKKKNAGQEDSEFIDCIQTCLRKILQYWAKGQQSSDNKWNKCALVMCGSMISLMARGQEREYTKCYKLMGFVLAKSANMGEVPHQILLHCDI